MANEDKIDMNAVFERSRKGFKDFNSEEHITKLEQEYEYMQQSFLALTSQLARIQFSLQQIIQAVPWQRDALLRELEKIAFKSANQTAPDEMPTVYRDFHSIDQIRHKQSKIMNRLKQQTMTLIESLALWSKDSESASDKQHNKSSRDYVIVEGVRKPRKTNKTCHLPIEEKN